MMKTELELVHFQITRGCNLRCWFCGQWGKQGFFRDDGGRALTLEDWLRIAGELKTLDPLPSIMLWGGEPLVCPFFEELAAALHEMGFPLGMVTNGTLLGDHPEACRKYFRQIYVSVDGKQPIHDGIRGQGVFEKVRQNLRRLRPFSGTLSINTVLTPALLADLPGTLEAFRELEPDQVLLQEMIGLSPAEVAQYRKWLWEAFSQEAREIGSWESAVSTLGGQLPELGDYPFRVIYKPQGEACGKHCYSPWHHAHVTWKGNVTFCTDFYDFSAGNVHETPLLEIFENGTSRRFREETARGNNPCCGHCSWRGSESFRL